MEIEICGRRGVLGARIVSGSGGGSVDGCGVLWGAHCDGDGVRSVGGSKEYGCGCLKLV